MRPYSPRFLPRQVCSFRTKEEEVEAENLNLGVNLKFQATDNLAINVDVSVSDTEAPIFLSGALMRNTRTQMTWEKFGAGRLPSDNLD